MKSLPQFVAMSLIALGSAAFAHGNEDHDKKTDAAHANHESHASALGEPGEPNKVNRTVEITMSDSMRLRRQALRPDATRRFASCSTTRASSSTRWCWARSRS